MRIMFTPRADVLEPIAVVGLKDAARALARRLLALEEEQLRELRGAAGEGVLIALGETVALPWAEGVTYLGQDPEAPRLLVPTMLRPSFAFDVFERAIARLAQPSPGPWAVMPFPPCIFSVANAIALDSDEILKWLDEQP